MRSIDLDSWPRRAHYETFRNIDYPHFNITSTIDVEQLLPISRGHDASLTIAITYLLAYTANQIENFRWRIRGNQVIEHELVHPSITILAADDLFSFCTMEYVPGFSKFADGAVASIAHMRENPSLQDKYNQDELLFMTSIPWIPFTSFMHPIHLHPVDSIPRFAWGKIHKIEGRQKLPLSVQGHHALLDGLHVGRYFENMQNNCDNSEALLNT